VKTEILDFGIEDGPRTSVEMPEMWKALCQPQPVAFLLPMHVGLASGREKPPRDQDPNGDRSLRVAAAKEEKNLDEARLKFRKEESLFQRKGPALREDLFAGTQPRQRLPLLRFAQNRDAV
jgi:hypothetical protein